MNDVKISIKDFGPISESNIELKKITVIKNENESEKILTKKLLKIVFSSLAYSSYKFQNHIAFCIRLAGLDIAKENRLLSECLYILESVLKEKKETVEIDFIQRIHEKAAKRIDSYFKEANLDYDNFPECYKITHMDYHYDKSIISKSVSTAFNTFFNSVFGNKEEFKKFLDEKQLKMFEEECTLYYRNIYKYFNDSKIELYGTLFDKKIDSEFEIFYGIPKIEVNKEFYEYFNPNEIIVIENRKSKDYEFGEEYVSIMDEIYHSEMFCSIRYREGMDIEKLMEGEYYPFYKILGGIFIVGKQITKFKSIEEDKEIFKNHPAGMNSLAKIQLLVENNFLRKDSILILDDIEELLTYKWQEKLAEILIYLAKEFEISICIFSNNDDYIRLIEKYAKKYNLMEECNFL